MRENPTFVLEEIDQTGHQVRQIYAHFGLAIATANGIEYLLNTMLAGGYVSGTKGITRNVFDERLKNRLWKKTFGVTAREWRRSLKQEDPLNDLLMKCVKTRNWLAHRYWHERCGHFNTAEGRDFMLAELLSIQAEFDSLDVIISEKTTSYRKRLGVVDDSILVAAEKEIIEAARKHIADNQTI